MKLKRRYWAILLGAFGIVSVWTGLWFSAQLKEQRNQIKDSLLAVATLKELQINQWRAERLADAALIAESPPFRNALASWPVNPGEAAAALLQERLSALVRHYKYDAILLIGSDGSSGFSIGENLASVSENERALSAKCVQARASMLGESLYPEAGGAKQNLFVVAPIFATGEKKGELLAFLLIRIDPMRYIFPVLQTWPKAYKSAEVLLGRRSGDEVVVMNLPRMEGDPPGEYRISADEPAYRVCQQAASGKVGILEGKDYRGVAVLAAAQAIPDSDWFILVKVDASEVLQHLYLHALLAAVSLLGSLALLITIGVIVHVREAQSVLKARLHAELQQRKSEERYHIALRSVHDGIIATDVHGLVELMNSSAEVLTGWSKSAARGKAFNSVFRTMVEDRGEPGEDLVAQVLRDAQSIAVPDKIMLIARDGLERAICVSASPMKDEHDKIIGVVVTFRDRTEKNAAEKLLRDREAEYRQVTDSIEDAILKIDADSGQVVFATRAMERIFGYPQEEIIGMSVQKLMPGLLARNVERLDLSVGEASTDAMSTPRREYTGIHQDGRGIDLSIALGELVTEGRRYYIGILSDITESKVEQAKLQMLFDNSLLGIGICEIVLDPEGTPIDYVHVKINRTFSEQSGMRAASVLGRPISEVLPRADVAPLIERYGKVVKTGIADQFECHIEALGRDFEINVFALGSNSFGVMFRDISDRQRAYGELARFRRFLEQANDCIEVYQPDSGRLCDVNQRACEALGYNREELLEARIFDLYPSLDETSFSAYRNRILKEGALTWVGTRRRKDGSTFPVESSLKYVQEGQDYIIAVTRDISERVRNQEQMLLQSAALNAAANAIVITDALGTIEWVNAAFSNLTGYSSDEAIGKNPSALVKSGVHPEAFYAALWETIMSGQVWTGELTNRRKDGRLYREEQTITPLLDEHGEIQHHIAIKQDITAKRELEEQYLQAQKMESVGRLAGGIAHDFNNLLTVIRGYTEMAIAQLNPDDDAAEDMAEVLRAGDRAVGLTRQLLAFARRQGIEPEVLNLNTALDALPRMLEFLIGENIELYWKPGANLWSVMIDRAQLEQIVVNLVVNARDAIADVGRVSIATENVSIDEDSCMGHEGSQPGDYIRLTVEDTGMGMSEELLSNIFEPFFTTKERGKGTGLGLAMVHGIVKENHGFIRVDSEQGVGTAMHIFLTRHAKPELSADLPADAALAYTGNETVLVVEDSLPLLRLAKITIERLGYTVLSCSDPIEAVELVANYPESIDLLITDVIMPRMNGLELSRRLMRMRPGLKVLFMSGYTADVIAKHGVLEDDITLLNKPFTSLSLAEKVRAVLDQHGHGTSVDEEKELEAAVAPLA